MKGSGMLLCGVIAAMPVWINAPKWPSASAPIATRCSVSVRPPTTRYTPSRDRVTRTGRPISFAAEAPADIGRDHPHLLRLEAEYVGDRRRLASNHLGSVIEGEFVAIPRDG